MTTATIKLHTPDHDVSLRASAATLVKAAKLWRSRARQRKHLLALSVDQLQDVGITREAALKESAKPFWHA